MLQKRKIDHLVYTIPNLEEGINWFEKNAGIRPIFGGYHPTQGTKNAVLNLGNDCYLELLAIDHNNFQIPPPRWMGVDLIDAPKITRWSIKSSNLEQDSAILKMYNINMGRIQGGQRKMSDGNVLTWSMSLPLVIPEVEIIPFLIDWQHSIFHPTKKLPQLGHLMDLKFSHPTPAKFTSILEHLSLDITIVKSEKISIKASIQTPKGIIEI